MKKKKQNEEKFSPSRRRMLGYTASAALTSLLVGKNLSAFGKNKDTKIVRAAIHPGIGIARIGNSTHENGFYIGPEVIEPPFLKERDYRDSSGALKRQAARFRVYGYNAAGEVVREILPSENTKIEWQVHLANKKADWYRFIVALDTDDAKEKKVSCIRRNRDVTGSDRAKLRIDPGPRKISGKNISGRAFHFDSGKFQDVPVSLGELRTDARGRLLVLGGWGKAGSPDGRSVFKMDDVDSFNNADGWYDDTSDGPVSAKVTIDGQEIENVESSWVVIAPPNYAPDIIGWRTLYDLLIQTYKDSKMLTVPETTSFTRDILPLLRRLSNLQWVNKGFADAFGFASDTEHNFNDLDYIERLARGSDTELKKRVHSFFRVSKRFNSMNTSGTNIRSFWPMMYGDTFGTFSESDEVTFIVSGLNETHLERWLSGNYINDWSPDRLKSYRLLSQVPLQDRPAMLDKSALHFCLADAFHPGCEVTWPMRWASLYRAPFRIKQGISNSKEKDYGDRLDSENVFQSDGPLYAQGPGDLTKWMAVPWQGDTVFCRSGYEPDFDPYLLTFWPARVPNHVLSESDYKTAIDPNESLENRKEAFLRREHWVRAMKGSPEEQILQMVREFDRIGVVEAKEGVRGSASLPEIMFVESLPPTTFTSVPEAAYPPTPKTTRDPPMPLDENVAKAGWESNQQLEEFRSIRMPQRK